MPTAETLRALLALVEEAKAGSRELDGHLTAAFDPPMDYAGEPADIFIRMNDDDCGVFKSYVATPASYTQSVPPLTTSIDAALALVAKVLPGWDVSLELSGKADSFIGWATLQGPEFSDHDMRQWSQSEGIRPMPLAILDALLRALIQQSETAHVER